MSEDPAPYGPIETRAQLDATSLEELQTCCNRMNAVLAILRERAAAAALLRSERALARAHRAARRPMRTR